MPRDNNAWTDFFVASIYRSDQISLQMDVLQNFDRLFPGAPELLADQLAAFAIVPGHPIERD
jgi:hypothetical protein